MKGKVVVITGGTSGIGQVAAERLAGMGARLVLVARDKARGEATLERLRERAPGVAHCIYYADLSRLAQMKQVAAERRIDVLINNAGPLLPSVIACAVVDAIAGWRSYRAVLVRWGLMPVT